MTNSEISCKYVITESLKKRFCKDTNIPIKIFEEPYFSHFLQLYDKQFDAVSKYKRFVETVESCGGEQSYFEEYERLKDSMIKYLSDNPDMQKFSREIDMNQFACKNTGFPTRDIFKVTNDGKYFVSIDMVKGNFTAVSHYNRSIVGNASTYQEFIGLFTNRKHFIESKYIRQVVFGNLNPKRQVTYEKYLMDKVLTQLLECDISPDSVEFFSTDEIVLSIPSAFIVDNSVSDEYVEKIEKVISWAKSQDINVRSEFFRLNSIKGTEGFIKTFVGPDSGVEFKCLDFLSYPFVLRKFYNEPICEYDRIFLYDGKKVKLIEDIQVEF